mgnify:CR=1 FL=1
MVVKVFIDEMTWSELKDRMLETDIAYLPLGTIECHGPHLPMGTDYYVATAVCVLAARKTSGVVMPPLTYNFTGATNAFKGTIGIPMKLEMEMIKAILKSLWEQGFKRLFVVSTHGPNDVPIRMAIRELYEYDKVIAVYFNPHKIAVSLISKEGHKDGAWLEATLLFASLKVLGKEHLIPKLEAIRTLEGPPIELPGLYDIWRLGGRVGYRYTHFLQHVPPRGNIDLDYGAELLERVSEVLVELAKPLKLYVEYHIREWARK